MYRNSTAFSTRQPVHQECYLVILEPRLPVSMTVDRYAIVRSYRSLYRHALRAVQYSSPARYTLKNHLRLAYRGSSVEAFSPIRIDNTLLFLKHAAEERGFEHRMLKNLLHVWWWQAQPSRQKKEYVNLTVSKSSGLIVNGGLVQAVSPLQVPRQEARLVHQHSNTSM